MSDDTSEYRQQWLERKRSSLMAVTAAIASADRVIREYKGRRTDLVKRQARLKQEIADKEKQNNDGA